jgi:hypothetical protein
MRKWISSFAAALVMACAGASSASAYDQPVAITDGASISADEAIAPGEAADRSSWG